eukprot:351140-Chlamydomonas_euryale.AAC.33
MSPAAAGVAGRMAHFLHAWRVLPVTRQFHACNLYSICPQHVYIEIAPSTVVSASYAESSILSTTWVPPCCHCADFIRTHVHTQQESASQRSEDVSLSVNSVADSISSAIGKRYLYMFARMVNTSAGNPDYARECNVNGVGNLAGSSHSQKT